MGTKNNEWAKAVQPKKTYKCVINIFSIGRIDFVSIAKKTHLK